MRVRTPVSAAAIAASLVASVAFTAPVDVAAERLDAAQTVQRDPGPGYFSTSNIEWLGMIPFNSGSAGARVLDGRLYVTDQLGITIYDLSDPTLPTPVSFTPSPQTYYFTEEDVDTNGEILVVGSFGEALPGSLPTDTVFVYDVTTTPTATLLGSISGVDADQHTLTCLLDCTYVYGSGGAIIDLTDPTSPQRVGDWRESDAATSLGVTYAHDITEVAPGIAMFSSNPTMMLADVTDPRNPVALAAGQFPYALAHGNLWPQGATDDFLLVGGETGGTCNDTDAGEFTTYDARPLKAALGIESGATLDPATLRARVDGLAVEDLPQFTEVDVHRVSTGLYTDGDSPYNQFCSHWFTTEPAYADGGLVAAAWYEHGTRLLDVSPEGEVDEVGWFVPLGGSQSAAYFVTDDIVLTTDYQRGIDILRIHRDADGEVVPAGPGLTMVGQAAGVADGSIDPDSFFPWFGREGEIPLPGPVFTASGAYLCPLPFRG